MQVSIHHIRPPQLDINEAVLGSAIVMAATWGKTGKLPPLTVTKVGNMYDIEGDPLPYYVAHCVKLATVSIQFALKRDSNGNESSQCEDGGNLRGPGIQLPRINSPRLG